MIRVDRQGGMIEQAVELLYLQRASRRAHRPCRITRAQVDRIVAAADRAGLNPLDLVDRAFADLPAAVCRALFRIPWPPPNFIHARTNVLYAAQRVAATPVDACARMLLDEGYAQRLPDPALQIAVANGTLGAPWAAAVCADGTHPRHSCVRECVRRFSMELPELPPGRLRAFTEARTHDYRAPRG